MNTYPGFDIETEDQVATVRILPLTDMPPGTDPHWQLGAIFSDLRGDNSIRVIVLTGAKDGEFMVSFPTQEYLGAAARKRLMEPHGQWRTFTGLIRCHQAMAEIEKPIVARLNGDAIGYGQSLMLACDLIVARQDAKVVDIHLGMGEVKPSHGQYPVGMPYGVVPGDGGLALAPLFMTPTKAKEYLMLAAEYTAADFARMGIINYAVPMAELDATVDDMVSRLLKRPAYALAWTKRIANRQVVAHLNMTLDAAAAYEMVNFLQLGEGGAQEQTL